MEEKDITLSKFESGVNFTENKDLIDEQIKDNMNIFIIRNRYWLYNWIEVLQKNTYPTEKQKDNSVVKLDIS